MLLVCFQLLLASVLFAQGVSKELGTVSGLVQQPGGTSVAKVTVSLIPAGDEASSGLTGTPALSAFSDAQGHFHLNAVPAGEYRVILQKNGFVSGGRKSQQDSPTLVTVGNGEQVDGLLFRLLPAGVIKGKIVDEDGDPLPDVQVVAMQASGRGVSGNGATNDLGEYRIPGLAAGKYLIAAQAGGAFPAHRNDAGVPLIYAPTFFPGTLDRSQAASIDVKAGDEVDAGFGLLTSRTYAVRGQVLSPSASARPTRDEIPPMLWLQRADLQQGSQLFISVEPDGTFSADNVLPGTYRVLGRARNGERWGLTRGTDPIEVRSDVEGLTLVPQPAAEVRGHFRLDTGKTFNWAQLTVTLDAEDEQPGGVPGVKVNRDGSFKVENVPLGNYHVVVTADSNNLRDYIMKEVNLNGKDVGDSGFAVGSGISTLDIVASADGSAIVGTLVDGDNRTVTDLQVVCVPDEPRRKRHDIYQQERTNSRGQFSFLGLNPGEYLIFPVNDEGADAITDPDFIHEHESTAERIHVEAGEHKTVTLNFSWDSSR